MKYTIYLRTNKLNGKQYVGQTKDFKNREKDWKTINERYGNKLLQKDREEFGLDAFNVKILSEVDTQEEAWELEKAFIKAFNTKYPNGYNMGDGGKDQTGTKHTEESKKNMSVAHIGNYHSKETKRKLSEINKGHTPWNKGVKNCFSEEYIKKMSERMRGENHPFWGKHLSEETKRKIGEFFKGKPSWIKGKHHTEEAKRKLSEAKKGIPNLALSKKVYQYSLEKELLKEWTSCSEASRVLGYSTSEISVCCRGGRYKNGKWVVSKTYKGFIWSYTPLN